MTVDRGSTADTSTWTLPNKVFYPTNIPIGHSQLRHLISSPSPGIVYFVDGCRVFCLDSVTRTRILVTELPFEPICTASGYGWFCAGGEKNGYFAALRIPDGLAYEDLVEGCQPGQPHRSVMIDHLERLYTGLPPPIRIERLGTLILNSISLHILHGSGPEEVEDEVVAVLTNNDMTVRIYSLTRDKEIMKEKFEFPMNHATISPNGRLLMIVGDREIAYFYTRIDGNNEIAEGVNGRGIFQDKMWLPLREVELHKPSPKGASAYFTTAWSPKGRLCATASEDGAITLLDADLLLQADQDPFYAMIASSRPDTAWGGVRSMCFAPDPWDLLIWNEDRGRTCMADIRHGLHMRQVNSLDPQSSTVKHAVLLEADLLLSNNRVPPNSQGLTEQELQILDGIRTTRQRQTHDTPAEARPSPRSINYIPPRSRQRMTDPAFLSSLREYFRDQNWDGGEVERRPNSLGRHGGSPTSGRIRSSSHRASATSQEPANTDPWSIIEAAMHQNPLSPAADSLANIATPTAATVNAEDLLPVSHDDDVALSRFISTNDISTVDPPSPRSQGTLPNLQEVGDLVASERQSGRYTYHPHRSQRMMMAGYRNEVSLREHIAELEAEVDATERQLLRGTSGSTPPPPADTGPSERELLERRRRLLAIAAVSEEVGAERRRRSLREPRSTMMTGGSNVAPVIGFSPRRDRDGALTTRGEAVLERQRQQREATERERPPTLAQEMAVNRSSMTNTQYERSMRDERRLELAFIERRRWSRLNELSGGGDSGVLEFGMSANPDAGLRTTGIAWGDGRTLFVGTEEGIFEMTLDFSERKFLPAIDMR